MDAGDARAAPRDASVAEELEPREALAAPPEATAQAAARLPAGRDGLRRRLPGHGHAATTARPLACRASATLVHTSSDGTSLLGIAQRGRVARPRSPQRHAPRRAASTELPLPAVVPLGRQTTGWCSTRSARRHVRIADPARGIRTRLPRRSSTRSGRGYAALLSPTPMLREALEEDRADYRWLVGVPAPAPARNRRAPRCSRCSRRRLQLAGTRSSRRSSSTTPSPRATPRCS